MKRMFDTMAVVGLGLLGGSAALAARRHNVVGHVVATGRRDLQPAVDAGVIDEAAPDIASAVANADVVLLAAPVETIRKQLAEVLQHAKPGAVITDAGSVKQQLVEESGHHPSEAWFVGSHPMVGSHLTGWENANQELFIGGMVYVTPGPTTNLQAAARTGTFWRRLGAKVVYTDAKRHDYLCSLLSHLPHLVAVGVMQHLEASREDMTLVRYLSGKGLRDTTRVAAGSAVMWEEICAQNQHNIARQLDEFSRVISELAATVRTGDCQTLSHILSHASKMRAEL